MQFVIGSSVCARGVRTSVRRRSLAVAVLSILVVLLSRSVAIAQNLPEGWTPSNIGNPAITGSASAAASTSCAATTAWCVGFSVAAGGADIWGTDDQFVFVSKPLQGDGAIVARVRDLQNTDPWAKAGLMMRESLTGDSRHGSIFVTPSQGVAFQRRTRTGGVTDHTAGSAEASSRWLKLERSGSTVTAYESADGRSWTHVGSDTLATGSALYVGVAVTSHNSLAPTTATVTDVSLTSGLPSDWTFSDLGTPAISGTAVSAGGGFALTGSGADVWGGADQFAYLYRPVLGDADIIARMVDLNGAHPWTKAGLMVRSSLSNDAAHAFAMVTGDNGIAFQGRPQTGAFSQQFGVIDGDAPVWLKIERRGVVVNAYTSAEGTRWSPLGSAVVALSNIVYVGMAVTSHDSSEVASATFDGVTVRELSVTGNLRPSVALTSPAANTGFVAPATVTLTATASDADGSIGTVEFHSGTTFLGSVNTSPYTAQWSGVAAGTYSVTATAFDNRGESSVSAPVSFTVRPADEPSITLPSWWEASEIGAPALSGSASYANGSFVVQAAGSDVWGSSDQLGFVYRQVSGDADIVVRVAGLEAPDAWTKAGVMVRGALSADAPHAFAMVTGANGIAYQGRPQTGAESLHFSGVTGAAPAWLKLERRGNVVTAFVSIDGAQWSTLGATTIALQTSAYIGIAVASRSPSQLASAVFSDVTVSAGAPPGNRAPTVSLTPSAFGASFVGPAAISLAASAFDSDGTIGRVDFYAGATLIGTDTSSPYALTWSNVPAGAYSLTAVAVDNEGARTTSGAIPIVVSPATAAPTRVMFTPSLDHSTLVQRYVLNVFEAAASVAAMAPVAMQDLGIPAVVNGEISADIAATLQSLPSGNYVATVTAVGGSGDSASEAVPFTK